MTFRQQVCTGIHAVAGYALLAAVVFSILLSGCSLPCTYQGKPVPAADAQRMRDLGMDVECP